MSETYSPVLQSLAYTIEWAKRRGTTPDALDPTEVISADRSIREQSGLVVSELMEENLALCGADGRVSLPTYPVKRLLPEHPEKYRAVIGELQARYLEAVKKCYGVENPASLVRMFSVGFGRDGYKPSDGETVSSISVYLEEQFRAAKEHAYRPIVEATTTLLRLKAAWATADKYGIEEIDVGLAFDSHGHLAGDGTELAEVVRYIGDNPDGYKTKVILGANCGSLTGIEKAASRNPGVLDFAYPNNVDIANLDHMTDIDNGTIHHHSEPVTVEQFAQIAKQHRFRVISLCCGFEGPCLHKLKTVLRSGD